MPQDVWRRFENILEDTMIERRILEDFPGFGVYLDGANLALKAKDCFVAPEAGKSYTIMDVIESWTLYRCYTCCTKTPVFQDLLTPWEDLLVKYVGSDRVDEMKEILNRNGKAKKTEDNRGILADYFKLLKDILQDLKASMPPQPPSRRSGKGRKGKGQSQQNAGNGEPQVTMGGSPLSEKQDKDQTGGQPQDGGSGFGDAQTGKPEKSGKSGKSGGRTRRAGRKSDDESDAQSGTGSGDGKAEDEAKDSAGKSGSGRADKPSGSQNAKEASQSGSDTSNADGSDAGGQSESGSSSSSSGGKGAGGGKSESDEDGGAEKNGRSGGKDAKAEKPELKDEDFDRSLPERETFADALTKEAAETRQDNLSEAELDEQTFASLMTRLGSELTTSPDKIRQMRARSRIAGAERKEIPSTKDAEAKITRAMKNHVYALSWADRALRARGKSFDVRRVGRILAGDMRVFRAHAPHMDADCAVKIVIDLSGSMCNGAASTPAQDAVAGAQAVLNVFSTLLRVPVSVDVFGSNHLTIVDWNESPATAREWLERANGFMWTCSMGSTALLSAMTRAVLSLSTRREKRKILVVLTDGAPDGDESDPKLYKALFRYSRRWKVEPFLIGIGLYGGESRFFSSILPKENYCNIESSRELGDRIFEMVEGRMSSYLNS